jgi:hypothetical protein
VDAVVTDLAEGVDAGVMVSTGLFSLRVPVLCFYTGEVPRSIRSINHPLLTISQKGEEKYRFDVCTK